ncbi:MAG: hypothetical protein PHU06_02210 [Gallionella sp.]|nr:hypothetical protein [Gallionella sp.]MDD4958721.1 hypothetical protein [Gallionella sp.]
MNEESMPFFALPENLQTCNQAIDLIGKIKKESDLDKFLVSSLVDFLREIKAAPQKFDENCPYCIKVRGFGRYLFAKLNEIKEETDPNNISSAFLQETFIWFFYIFCEREFWDDFPYHRAIKEFALKNLTLFDPEAQFAITTASYGLPALLIKYYFQESSIKEFITNTKKFEQIKTESQRELDEREKRVAALNETLKEQETAFNFVGLNKGFNELSDKKKRELNFAFWGMVTLGIVMIGILLYEFGHITAYTAPIASLHMAASAVPATSAVSAASSIQNTPIYGMLPLAAIEFLLVYFFRIILSNYRSIKTQQLQIELRMTLCQFIQSYAEYAKDIKVNDPSALEKFENLIFSGILTDQQQLPSTFDGIEAISKLVESVRKK